MPWKKNWIASNKKGGHASYLSDIVFKVDSWLLDGKCIWSLSPSSSFIDTIRDPDCECILSAPVQYLFVLHFVQEEGFQWTCCYCLQGIIAGQYSFNIDRNIRQLQWNLEDNMFGWPANIDVCHVSMNCQYSFNTDRNIQKEKHDLNSVSSCQNFPRIGSWPMESVVSTAPSTFIPL